MTKVIQLAKPFVVRPYSKKELRTIMGIFKLVLNASLKTIQDDFGMPIAAGLRAAIKKQGNFIQG